MPSVSESQQRLFGMALAAKRGSKNPKSPEVKRLAETLSAAKLKEFASTKGKK